MTERKVSIHLPGHAYDILVRPGLLNDIGQLLAAKNKSAKAILISDTNVFPLHGPTVVQSLKTAKIEPIIALLPPGEDHKAMADLLPIYDTILSAKIERSTPILALGGGIVGDMAGFVAATVLRGVPLVQIPTTLLAMVDASVGGKTGVNHQAGKNLIGSFHQPIAVLIDPQVLKTLPPSELHGGLAECIKHDIIRDANGFADLESNIAKALSLDMNYLTDLIAHNLAIKGRVVEADPHEHGERAHLNFGHTFAHAIETVSHHHYSHGHAVALGMTAASFLAEKLGMVSSEDRRRIVNLIAKAGLPTNGLTFASKEIAAAMSFDKKVSAGKLRLVLCDGIGRAVVRADVSNDLVLAAVETLRG